MTANMTIENEFHESILSLKAVLKATVFPTKFPHQLFVYTVKKRVATKTLTIQESSIIPLNRS
jgi:hypothetical protein